MSRLELYSPEGLRIDGRRWNDMRTFECRINTHPNSSDGSSYVEQGNTKVICMVHGPMEPTLRSQANNDEATVEVNLNVASFSTSNRKKRSKNEKRMVELKVAIEKTFEESIMCHLYPRTMIQIDVHVLNQDGGLLSSVVNAITLAVIDAGISMYEYVSAVSVGLHDQSPLLDLNALEENDMSMLTVGIIGKSEKVAMFMMEDKMPLDRVEKALSVAITGAKDIQVLMDEQIRKKINGTR